MDRLLLCELHAHTTWSDGHLTLAELVDLYGGNGFDVLGVADDTVRLDDPMPSAVDSWTWPATSPRSPSRRSARWRITTSAPARPRAEHLASWKTLVPCEKDPPPSSTICARADESA
jgi:hypothetical protein